jgi:peptidoglycan/LPS O-acetylase OafA/YrhL
MQYRPEIDIAIRHDGRRHAILSPRAVGHVGKMSHSLYLRHWFFAASIGFTSRK